MNSKPAHRPRATSGHVFSTTAFWRLFPAGMRRSWWLFRPFDLIARYWPVLKKRKGVLVVRMDGIGDMAVFRTSLDHYAEAFGVDKSHITVLGCRSWSGIADIVFKGYQVHTIKERDFARRLLYRFIVSLWARHLAPEVVVCDSFFRRAMIADSLIWVIGAPHTVVSLPYINESTRTEFTYFLSQVDTILDTGDYPTHEVVRHYRFVSELLGRKIDPCLPSISWQDKKPPLPDGPSYVVLNSESNEPGRRWPFDDYLSIARRFLAVGYRVVFVGIQARKDTALKIQGLEGGEAVVDLMGQTSLAQLMDVMKHAALVVSNDTGPAHLSIALKTPTLVLVGGGHFGCFFPYPKSIVPSWVRFVSYKMDCYHCFWRCSKRATEFDIFPCVGSIAVDDVWRQACGLLGVD